MTKMLDLSKWGCAILASSSLEQEGLHIFVIVAYPVKYCLRFCVLKYSFIMKKNLLILTWKYEVHNFKGESTNSKVYVKPAIKYVGQVKNIVHT